MVPQINSNDDVNSVSTSPAILLTKEDDGIRSIDSAELGGNGTIMEQLFSRLNPTQCLSPNSACSAIIEEEDDIQFDQILPNLVRDMQQPQGKARGAALSRLYRLTDQTHADNRTKLVQAKVSIWEGLEPCLAEAANARDRRQALLLLNNLCVPTENKHIVITDGLETIIPSLMGILRERLPESYLAAVCLYNLSFLDEAKDVLYSFIPHVTCDQVKTSYQFDKPTGETKPETLVGTIEDLCREYAPFLKRGPMESSSVQVQAIRWCLGFIRNVSTVATYAKHIVRRTIFPQLVSEYLALHAPNDKMHLWTQDSLPDLCLLLLVQWVAFEDCLPPLLNETVQDALLKLQGKGGIHETRARAILVRLKEEKEQIKDMVVDETKAEF